MFMMMLKMMMIVLMIPTIDKTDRQYQHQQHLTTPTTHHIVEHEHDFIALHWYCIGSNSIKFILFIQFIYNWKETEGNFFNVSSEPSLV